jgi:hypothetical protein
MPSSLRKKLIKVIHPSLRRSASEGGMGPPLKGSPDKSDETSTLGVGAPDVQTGAASSKPPALSCKGQGVEGVSSALADKVSLSGVGVPGAETGSAQSSKPSAQSRKGEVGDSPRHLVRLPRCHLPRWVAAQTQTDLPLSRSGWHRRR